MWRRFARVTRVRNHLNAARRFPPPWSVEVSVDDLRYCSRCERSCLLLQSFSALRLRWHRQHPGRPNIVARRKPIRRLITRPPAVHPPAASRLVPRVYRQTRLVGQGRMTGDTLANRRPHCFSKDEARRVADVLTALLSVASGNHRSGGCDSDSKAQK